MNEKPLPALADDERCTGCAACANVCPKDAIAMLPDGEGFLQPSVDESKCIGCKKCERTCPVLTPRYENAAVDTCYAMWASNELRAQSSTAGFFLLAAHYVLAAGGTVYGAAWTADWQVQHVRAENKAELQPIVKSKYVQSEIALSYRAVKADLQAGRTVLFTGTPCQIAGLYAFLGSGAHENLFTVEIICHGVPSPKAFQKYLDDTFGNKKKSLKSIDFRAKDVDNWSTTTTTTFTDNSVYHKNEREDPWYRAFLPCMSMRKSCSNCPFSRLPRQADITSGDFWGVDQYNKSWNDKKGTSVLLVNNARGESLFTALKPNMQRVERIPLEYALRVNKTIVHPFARHPARKHFYASLDIVPFCTLVENALAHKYDVGIVGLWYGINYGSVLTYFALYTVVRSLGFDAVMIPKLPTLWDKKFDSPKSIAQQFIWKHCNVFARMKSAGEMYRMNEHCRDFVLGSDVVWNYEICGKDVDQHFFLDWVESGHKKIAFAASFGNTLSGSDSYKKRAVENMSRFDAISCREDSGAETVRALTGRNDIAQVLDPVFLVERHVYEALAAQEPPIEKSYIFSYLLISGIVSSPLHKRILSVIANATSAVPKICINPNEYDAGKKVYNDVLPLISVEDWISYLRHCNFFFGDSYHGLCFSLIFHKPFLIAYYTNRNNAVQRMQSLLRLVGLEERLITTTDFTDEAIARIIQTPIDWNAVERRLEPMREKSLCWLGSALQQPPQELSVQDEHRLALQKTIAEQQIQIDSLSERLCTLEKLLDLRIGDCTHKAGRQDARLVELMSRVSLLETAVCTSQKKPFQKEDMSPSYKYTRGGVHYSGIIPLLLQHNLTISLQDTYVRRIAKRACLFFVSKTSSRLTNKEYLCSRKSVTSLPCCAA